MSVIVFRGLLEDSESFSAIREIEAFRILASRSSTRKYFLREDTFDSALLGHRELSIPQGPLTVAALGWDPPERSTHFHLSLLSVDGDTLSEPDVDEDLSEVVSALRVLNTKSMTLLEGEGKDHALVWERRVDLRTLEPHEAKGMGYLAARPEGDQENDLRRLIDDSVNVLSELDVNKRRIDAGIAPVNIVWPWGQGIRPTVSNLALRLGYPWRVASASLALRGYARLSGLRIQAWPRLNQIHGKDVSRVIEEFKKESHLLLDIDFSGLQGEEHLEEKIYKADVLGRTLLLPLLEYCKDRDYPLWILASNSANDGLISSVEFRDSGRDMFPFDERVLTEREVPEVNLTQLLANAWR